MLSSEFWDKDVTMAMNAYREMHTATISGMTRYEDHLDDMPARGYARSSIVVGRRQSFLSLLFGHIANYHSRGSFNSPEQLSSYGDGIKGRWTYSDSFRSYLHNGTNEVDIDFCTPSTTLPAIMTRWMMVFEERDLDVVALLRLAPRRMFMPSVGVKTPA